VIGLVPNKSSLKSTFFNEILYLEVSDAKDYHLSVIDASSIFERTTSGVTTKADMKMVEGMVYNYMKNPRYVMLVVVPANVYIATHKFLEKAKDVDRKRTRTLGVLMKPNIDHVLFHTFVDYLVEGRILGSNLVGMSFAMLVKQNFRGPGFFDQKAPWNGLAKDKVGIRQVAQLYSIRLFNWFAGASGV